MHLKGIKIVSAILASIFIALLIITLFLTDDIAFKKVIEQRNEKLCVEFLAEHKNSRHIDSVKTILEEIRFEKMELAYSKIQNSTDISLIKSFIDQYPNSPYLEKVRIDLEELEFKNAMKKNSSVKECRDFLKNYPHSNYCQSIQKRIANLELEYYKNYINVSDSKLDKQKILDYALLFPNGKYKSQARKQLYKLQDTDDYMTAVLKNTKEEWEAYLKKHPTGKHASKAKAKLQEIADFEKYKNHSLNNGAQPYANKYGQNSSCDYYGCSEIVINAPYNSDIVAIIKNNSDRVVRHAYIRSGCSWTFEVPNGRYKPYFYYGKGWYPKKEMSKGVKGGFLTNELHSYANSSYLENQIWTITLQLTTNGNMSTHPCSEGDMF